MPTKGQVITNPKNGNSYEFVETASDTNGKYVVMKATLNGKGMNVPNHIHTLQDETFEVISGKLTVWVNGTTTTLAAGEKIMLPKNKPHNHYNHHDDPVSFVQTVTPALDTEHLVETLFGLAAEGKSKNGEYGLVQKMVILKYLDSKTFLADIPIGVQKLLMNVVAPIGRLLGYRAVYKKYSGIEK